MKSRSYTYFSPNTYYLLMFSS